MPAPLKIACLVMKYPTLSQTFIERDLLGLVAQGIEVEVHPIWDFRRPEEIDQITPAQLRVVRAGGWRRLLADAAREGWSVLRENPAQARTAARVLWANLPRHWEGWFMTLWGTLVGLAKAAEFRGSGVGIVHGAWATAPATAAAVLSARCGIPFSFGAHAYDLHRHGGDPLLAPKLRAARFVHTTTQINADAIRTRFPDATAEVVLSRRGLTELPALAEREPRDGPVRLLSVGRLVEKKGHAHQIDACWELTRRGADFRLKIVGDGPLRAALGVQIAGAGLGKHVELAGALRPAEVAEAYHWADVFWHTGVVDSQGDRDGLPNVIPEAFAYGLPVISSRAGGASEAVMDGVTGLLVDPENAGALADAVQHLAVDPALRARLGTAGRVWVEENFIAARNAARLAEAFRAASAAPTAATG